MKRLRPPLTLYSDSSVYNNGDKEKQDAYYAVFLDDGTPEGKMVAYEHIGNHSVNEGEYLGVIAALTWIADNDLDRRAIVITDSQLVVGHVVGTKVLDRTTGKFSVRPWHCAEYTTDGSKSPLPELRDRVRHLLDLTDSDLIWKRRNRNMAGWFFEKEVERKRKEKYRKKKERKRVKRKRVRKWTLDNPEQSGYKGRGPRGRSRLSA